MHTHTHTHLQTHLHRIVPPRPNPSPPFPLALPAGVPSPFLPAAALLARVAPRQLHHRGRARLATAGRRRHVSSNRCGPRGAGGVEGAGFGWVGRGRGGSIPAFRIRASSNSELTCSDATGRMPGGCARAAEASRRVAAGIPTLRRPHGGGSLAALFAVFAQQSRRRGRSASRRPAGRRAAAAAD
jgi:hypothetical protein